MAKNNDLISISEQFRIKGDFNYARRFGNGHINDTFVVSYNRDSRDTRYIIQKINHRVFLDPAALMDNTVRITSHIRAKLKSKGIGDLDRRCLTLIPTRNDAGYHVSEAGDYWRAFHFIENAKTYNFASEPRHAYEAAKAFGLFQALLVDFPAGELQEAIPDFHNTLKRFDALSNAIERDVALRVARVEREIQFALLKRPIAGSLIDSLEATDIKQRVIHNDTKLSNVMIDNDTAEGICIIDLDTVGPGWVPYDFGDLVRSATCPALEGEPDLDKIEVKMEMFEAAAEGYMSCAREFLTKTEIEHLPFAGKLLAFETGIRFLTDYLEGDIYFKTKNEHENLNRCRSQFKLVESFERHENAMYQFIKRL